MGNYTDQTTVHPVGLTVLVVLGLLVLLLPRRFAVIPFVVLACVVPSAQRVVVFGLDFDFNRLLVLFAVVRLGLRGEVNRLHWTPLDYAFLAWAASSAVIAVIRESTSSMLIFQLGRTFDAIGLYFVFRLLIRRWGDLGHIALGALFSSIFTAVFFAVEAQTGRNLFSVLGGVSEFTQMREGRLRCQGAFQHPIIAGVFWASLLPLIAARWWHPKASRLLVVVGGLSVVTIVLATATSTSVLVILATVAAAFFYPLRFYLRPIRWAIALGVIGLQLVMKAPVWHLISRVAVVSGSTGYHRFKLIDVFLRNFGEWWLIGAVTLAHWGGGLTQNKRLGGALDLTNEYVSQGVRGGLLSLVLLICILAFAYRQVGMCLLRTRKIRGMSAYAWALGLCVFAHMIIMLSISYWNQILVPWYMTLAAISSLTPKTEASAKSHRDRPPRSPKARVLVSAGAQSAHSTS